MTPLVRENRYSGLRHHAKVHSFRILTVVLAWLFIAGGFLPKTRIAYVASARDTTKYGNRRR